jgi:hypothetical protein
MDRAARKAAPGARRAATDRALVGLAVLVALTAASAIVLGQADWDLANLTRPRAYIEVEGKAVAVPRAVPATGRVLPAVPVTTSGSHAFLHTTEDGAPVGYDPCRPITYVLRVDGAPTGGDALVADAVAVISQAAGVQLVLGGTTDEPPTADRPLIQEERYGDGWAPVLIAWGQEQEMPELAGQVAGVGGSAAVPGADGEGLWLAAGRVVLDAPDITTLLQRPDGYAQARAVVVHELGHVLGLDHVDDPSELMYPVTTRNDLGPGDREGLALLGQVECEA